jgi:serine/threonine-protein kinase
MFRLRREIGAARQLGQYTLEKLIGEGGMGKVYKARHALLRRPTAVKVLAGRDAGPNAIARFEREVLVASSLTHPNTVEIFDYGRTDDGIFYFAMEYLPGITLDELVRREGAIGAPRVLHILVQILGSLSEAHDLGLVHRDIKPANIILCRRGGVPDFVKVVDFGLAKDLSFNLAPEITQTGFISGTPLYIAPECLTDPANTSPLSDIFAVGAVTFFLLTGRELFTGASPLEVLRKVSHERRPQVGDFVPLGIPSELATLVHRCVAIDPQERPASVEEMLQVVEPLAARYPWTRADAQQWWQNYDAPQDSTGRTRAS